MAYLRKRDGSSDRGGASSKAYRDCTAHKKEILLETEAMDFLSLRFQSTELETLWRLRNANRQRGISIRFLVMCALFQVCFLAADRLDNVHSAVIFPARCLLCAQAFGAAVLGFTGLIPVANQRVMFGLLSFYGTGTLWAHYSTRPELTASHWSALYLVYGLIFVIVPKITPLDFAHATSGTILLSMVFLSLSARVQTFVAWLLSASYLLVVVSLLVYVAYMSEKSSRERWLLRQRLERERIQVQLVPMGPDGKSIDMNPFSLIHEQLSSLAPATLIAIDKGMSVLPGNNPPNNTGHNSHPASARALPLNGSQQPAGAAATTTTTPERSAATTRPHAHTNPNTPPTTTFAAGAPPVREKNYFIRGLAVWGLCSAMAPAGVGWSGPAELVKDLVVLAGSHGGHMHTGAAWALFMHAIGFSFFLLLVTRQVRWLLVNAAGAMVLLWFTTALIPDDWVLFTAHTFGYLLLAVTAIVLLGVFGGVVLLWTQLLDFLTSLCSTYPQVHDELRQHRLLEQVLVDRLSAVKPGILQPLGSDIESPHTAQPGSALASLPLTQHPTNRHQASASGGASVCGSLGSGAHRPIGENGSAGRHQHQHQHHRPSEQHQHNQQCPDSPPITMVLHHPSQRAMPSQSNSSGRSGGGQGSGGGLEQRPCCFFCSRADVVFYLPACAGWAPDEQTNGEAQAATNRQFGLEAVLRGRVAKGP